MCAGDMQSQQLVIGGWGDYQIQFLGTTVFENELKKWLHLRTMFDNVLLRNSFISEQCLIMYLSQMAPY